MKTNTQKFIGLLALLFTMSFTVNAQQIGDDYDGGYIFQINDDGTGLVADLENLEDMNWYDAMSTPESYEDWYLPSIEELEIMFNTIGPGANNSANFASGYYWSSSESDGDFAFFYSFGGGYESIYGKHSVLKVRLIRSVTFEAEVPGCTDPAAYNYNSDANTNDGSCVAVVNGCTDPSALNYNAAANTDDGSCIVVVNNNGFIYTSPITSGSGNAIQLVSPASCDFLPNNWTAECQNNIGDCSGEYAVLDDGNGNYYTVMLQFYSWGCCYPEDAGYCEPWDTYDNGVEYIDVHFTNSDGSQGSYMPTIDYLPHWFDSDITNASVYIYSSFEAASSAANSGNFVPATVAEVLGCTDATAFNYYPQANTDDGTCMSWEEVVSNLQADLDAAMANQEDGISQADVDAAYVEGVASVDITSDNQASFDAGAASVTPEDGIGQSDVDSAFAAGVASVEMPECEEVATLNIPLDLPQGWSMFGYTCMDSVDAVTAFSEIADKIEIVKDEWGLAYITEWGFNGLGSLHFSEGYQIKMLEEVTDFQFCSTLVLSSEDVSEPTMIFGYGTYEILNWTQYGSPALPPGASSYMNINSDAILTIDIVASFPDDQGELINVYQSLFANYESDFTDMIYITPSGQEVTEFSVTVNENSFTLSGTFGDGSNIVIELAPTTTIPGCMDPNNPAWNSEANKNDNSCLEGCFDTNACNYGEEGATECTYPVNECDCEGNGPDYANASFQINLNDGDFDGINNVELTVNLWDGEQEMIIGLEDNNGDGIWEGNFDGAHGAMFDFVINVYGSELTTLSDCGGNPFVNGFPNPVADGLDVCNVWNNTIELNPFDCPEPQLQIGDIAHGGIVFQINEDGTGLVADLQDLGEMNWYNAMDAAENIFSGGYEDWYLPSLEQLELMYETIGIGGPENIGGFETYTWPYYWSSTEQSANYAWLVSFGASNPGGTGSDNKNDQGLVRVIRAF